MFKWAKRFNEGRESVKDDLREGALVTTRTDTNVDRMRTLITWDRLLSIRVLSDELNFHKETSIKMLHEDLSFRLGSLWRDIFKNDISLAEKKGF